VSHSDRRLADLLGDARLRTDAWLERVLAPAPDRPRRLVDACRHAVLGGGKRVRPAVVLMSARAVGGRGEDALPAAAALELVHAYSLVHDDLPCLDDDDERRGRPACHVAFGEAVGLLAGDALLTEAFAVLAAAPLPPAVRIEMVAALAAAAGMQGMVGGQVLDTDPASVPTDLEGVEALHAAKTGALFRCAVRLGGLAGDATPVQQAALQAYGEALGALFQVTDDVLDWEGDATPDDERAGSIVARLGMAGSRSRALDLQDRARAALAPLGTPGEPLAALAERIVHRTL